MQHFEESFLEAEDSQGVIAIYIFCDVCNFSLEDLSMTLKLMGKKRGMTQLFDDQGRVVPCTVIEIEPNVVTQLKSKERDGYVAVQLGFEKVVTSDPRTVVRRLGKPVVGHFKKSGLEPRRHLSETRLSETSAFSVGQEFGVDLFQSVAHVDVQGVTKGRGYQGVMKKFGFAGGPAAHGSGFHRHAGSTGMRSTPGRCFPGGKRASRLGFVRVTVQNLPVVKIDVEKRVIVVKGSIPGPRNGLVYVAPAVKKEPVLEKKKG